MENKRDYLDEAVNSKHYSYTNKGLQARAQPFLSTGLPSKPKRILIVGMALGGEEEVKAMKYYFPKYQVYGIDVAKSALRHQLNAKLFHADVAKMAFEDNFFAGVMCSAVMHEVFSFSNNGIEKVEKAIAEMHRVLVPGGIAAIREFFVPENQDAHLLCLTSEAEDFTHKFIETFRKNFDKSMRGQFRIEGNKVYADIRLLTEIMLHGRVAFVHSDLKEFFQSKEIEERYLPLSLTEYARMAWQQGFEIIGVSYNDFSKYYEIIEKHFKITDTQGNQLKNVFGFTDILLRKK